MTTTDSKIPPPIPLSSDAGGSVVYATFGQRLLAWVIDSFVLSLVQLIVFGAIGVVGALLQKFGLAADTAETVAGFGAFVIFLLIAWGYYALLEASRWQATFGKRAMGIEVADVEGGYATLAQTSVRFVLRFVSAFILCIGFLLCLLTRRHQTLHDIGANTVVIRTTPRPPALPAVA